MNGWQRPPRRHLYVCSRNTSIFRYDGATVALIDAFVPGSSENFSDSMNLLLAILNALLQKTILIIDFYRRRGIAWV